MNRRLLDVKLRPSPSGLRRRSSHSGNSPGARKRRYSFAMALSRLRLRVSHARFCVLFPLSLYVVCNAINIDRLAKWFRTGENLDFLALSAYLLAGLCLFIVVFTLLAHRGTTRPLAVVLVITAAAATYFISKYGVAIDSSMVRNAVHTDSTEVGQLMSAQMIPYVVFLMVLP